MRRAWMILALGGCWGEQAVDVNLVLPSAAVSATYDTSCVTAVEIYVDGKNYPTDDADFLRDCIDLDKPGATFQDIKNQIHGQFDTKIPTSGLGGIELFAYNGTCGAARHRDYDLLFYASASYTGGDELTLPITPNINCTPLDVTVRPVDILKYVKTQNCAMSTWTLGKLALSTLSPLPFTDETYWWGGQSSAPATGGLVNLRGTARDVGPNSCLAIGLYTDDWNEVTCTPPADQRMCATGAEVEAPMINDIVGYNTGDPSIINKYGGLVVGAVVGPTPVAGATVTIDPDYADRGKVVYFDMPPGVENGTGVLVPRAEQMTGPSGLFGIYTMSIVRFTVTAGGKTAKRTVGGNEDSLTALFIKL
jgi:hypothetical protein